MPNRCLLRRLRRSGTLYGARGLSELGGIIIWRLRIESKVLVKYRFLAQKFRASQLIRFAHHRLGNTIEQ